ncbi:hypothetical protein A7K94_0218560 [Modestobacter sp. VKM Ac-2676]|nr:hypothetical protein A7K94_0218560 [Modestobacter sp. VKM Ac-2676]
MAPAPPVDRELIADCAERLGLTPLLGRPLSAVSGGQQQRALVAQGLVARATCCWSTSPPPESTR